MHELSQQNVLLSLHKREDCFEAGTNQWLRVEYGGGTRCET